jgi:hypothetical protein
MKHGNTKLKFGYVGVTGRGRSPRYWVQYGNLKEENCFENKNITNLDCTATLL